MRYIAQILLVLPLVLGQQVGKAQTCIIDKVIPTTPDERFIDRGDGSVQDKHTGLIWMRCSLGQVWDGATCSGTAAVYTWQQALQEAAGYTFAGSSTWRLPNVNELKSIVEKACYDPAINLTAFPATPSAPFWTASPLAPGYDYAWIVSFNYGNAYGGHKNSSSYFVRLVRPDSN